MTNDPVLNIEKLEFSYTKRSKRSLVLVDIRELAIQQGEIVGIVGDNGSGKSTLAKLILGLYSPLSGTIQIFGQEIKKGFHAPGLAYIGDPAYAPGWLGLPVNFLVGELIQAFQKVLKNSGTKLSFPSLDKDLGLTKLLSRRIRDLSKGERMKLMVYLALSKQPELLIADEATDGIDSNIKPIVLEAVRRIVEQGSSVLWITHKRIELAKLSANKVYRLISNNKDDNKVEGGILQEELSPKLKCLARVVNTQKKRTTCYTDWPSEKENFEEITFEEILECAHSEDFSKMHLVIKKKGDCT